MSQHSCRKGKYQIVKSQTLSKPNSPRYVITDVKDTTRILLDGNSYGFKSVESAKNALETAQNAIFVNGRVLTESERLTKKGQQTSSKPKPDKPKAPKGYLPPKDFDESLFEVRTKSAPKKTKISKDVKIRKILDERIDFMLNDFKAPSYDEIEPLADYFCRIVFKGYDLNRFVPFKQEGYSEVGTVAPMFLEDLDEVIASVGTATKWNSTEHAHFLDMLYTGNCVAIFDENEEELVGNRWLFQSVMDEYACLIEDAGDMFYTPLYDVIYDENDEDEVEYYERNVLDFVEAERKILLRRLDVDNLFYGYLYAQGWKRFVPLAKASIERSSKEFLEAHPEMTIEMFRESVNSFMTADKIQYNGGSMMDLMLNDVSHVPRPKRKKKGIFSKLLLPINDMVIWRYPESDHRRAVELGMIDCDLLEYKKRTGSSIDIAKNEGLALRELVITVDDMLAELKKDNLENTSLNRIEVAKRLADERKIPVSRRFEPTRKVF
jgi:hypothetical protein